MSIELCFGQRIDESCGLVEPWLTHGALDWIKQQNWEDKTVFMFGAGLGDAWLARRCGFLYVVERNSEWLERASGICSSNNVSNIEYLHRPCNDACGENEYYCEIPQGVSPDVVINDDAYRYEVIEMVVNRLKRPVVLITDNWQQDYVFMCQKAVDILSGFDSIIFEQHDHKDHQGNKWKTSIHFIV